MLVLARGLLIKREAVLESEEEVQIFLSFSWRSAWRYHRLRWNWVDVAVVLGGEEEEGEEDDDDDEEEERLLLSLDFSRRSAWRYHRLRWKWV